MSGDGRCECRSDPCCPCIVVQIPGRSDNNNAQRYLRFPEFKLMNFGPVGYNNHVCLLARDLLTIHFGGTAKSYTPFCLRSMCGFPCCKLVLVFPPFIPINSSTCLHLYHVGSFLPLHGTYPIKRTFRHQAIPSYTSIHPYSKNVSCWVVQQQSPLFSSSSWEMVSFLLHALLHFLVRNGG